MNAIERMLEWTVAYETRLGSLCEQQQPTPEQHAMAEAEAEEHCRQVEVEEQKQ